MAVGADKYTLEDDGFDGFGIRIEIIKSRVNQAGQSVNLIYDKMNGIDSIRSTIAYMKDLGLVGGNKNSMYFINNKDQKFSLVNVRSEFRERKELYKIMYDIVVPVLESRLSCLSEEESEMEAIDEEYDY